MITEWKEKEEPAKGASVGRDIEELLGDGVNRQIKREEPGAFEEANFKEETVSHTKHAGISLRLSTEIGQGVWHWGHHEWPQEEQFSDY